MGLSCVGDAPVDGRLQGFRSRSMLSSQEIDRPLSDRERDILEAETRQVSEANGGCV